MDRKYLLMAFGYAMVGLMLGIYMAHAKNHTQLVTHAHIMLLGFVMSFIYAVCYKVWLGEPTKLAKVQFMLHSVGSLVLLVALFLMFGHYASEQVLGPLLGIASVAVLAGVIIMKIQLIKLKRH